MFFTANLFWWADRNRGIGGMIASQTLPFGDLKVLGTWGALEAGINAALDKEVVTGQGKKE